jgi:hypothetical protein
MVLDFVFNREVVESIEELFDEVHDTREVTVLRLVSIFGMGSEDVVFLFDCVPFAHSRYSPDWSVVLAIDVRHVD